MSFTVPGSSLRIPQSHLGRTEQHGRMRVVPAGMHDAFVLAGKARPVFSVTGSASISARIATQPPGFFALYKGHDARRARALNAVAAKALQQLGDLVAGANSSLESSGWRWKSRRQEIISSKFSCTLLLISLILICPFFDQSGAREKRWTARAPGPVRRRRIILIIYDNFFVIAMN